jgi:peptidoglycan/xylan/chitin deacetylase (PgdA/CDA1 family)
MSKPGAGRSARAAILIYHSIADGDRDPFGIAVSPAAFAAHVEILARRFVPQSLSELCAGLDQEGTVPARSVVVTFDDGYANNLSAALPVLSAHAAPATLFVSTGYIGAEREFWWDELECLLYGAAGTGRDPTLELSLGGAVLRCSVDGRSPVHQIWSWLHRRSPGDVEAGLEQVRRWAGVEGTPAPRESHRPLTLEELRELSRSDSFEIAAHKRSHSKLASQSAAVQRAEIGGSRADLESWLGEPPASFAYPYGNPASDYSPATVELARELGFERAVSSSAGLAEPSSPRYFVTARTPADFERWLGGIGPARRHVALPGPLLDVRQKVRRTLVPPAVARGVTCSAVLGAHLVRHLGRRPAAGPAPSCCGLAPAGGRRRHRDLCRCGLAAGAEHAAAEPGPGEQDAQPATGPGGLNVSLMPRSTRRRFWM